ncbi:hypothetical protein BKA93DRAFT_822477 [Sparassis latifolia]
MKPGAPAQRIFKHRVATVVAQKSTVDQEFRNDRLVSLLAVPLHWDFFGYIVDCLVKASLVWSTAPSRYHSVAWPTEDTLKTAALFDFVKHLVVASRVNTAAVLVALVYVDRWSHSSVADVPQLSCEQVFLVALFLATKYVAESSYDLKYWKAWSAMSKAEIRWAERKFLKVIDFEVGIQEEHLLDHYDEVMKRCIINNERILPPLPEISPRRLVRRRAHAVRRVVAPAPAFIPSFPVQASPVSPAFGVLRREVDWSVHTGATVPFSPSLPPLSSSSSLSSSASSSSVATPYTLDKILQPPKILHKHHPVSHSLVLPGISKMISNPYNRLPG